MFQVNVYFEDGGAWHFDCVDAVDMANAIYCAKKQAESNGATLSTVEVYTGGARWIEIPFNVTEE